MKFGIITHVEHIKKGNQYFGYAPYIREMNIWLQYVDEVVVLAPLVGRKLNPIYEDYKHANVRFEEVKNFNVTTVKNALVTLLCLPSILISIYKVMRAVDHIHLRCPGNIGLLGALVQILFPKKPKTAKYAGNWDPNAKQPFTYKLQQWILANPFLTKNMQVLVYGEWPNQTKNIKSFFTATYSETKKEQLLPRSLKQMIKFVFVGTLSSGKRPLYAIQLVENLVKQGVEVELNMYGEGVLREELEDYIGKNKLGNIVFLKGNVSKDVVEQAYKESHFLILASKSEGWPKVVAEAMFWGCLPLATKISCVPYMLDYGKRGVLLEEHLDKDVSNIQYLIEDENKYQAMTQNAQNWSREYTLEFFEAEIKKLLL